MSPNNQSSTQQELYGRENCLEESGRIFPGDCHTILMISNKDFTPKSRGQYYSFTALANAIAFAARIQNYIHLPTI